MRQVGRGGALEVRLDVHAHAGGPAVVGMLLQSTPLEGDRAAWAKRALRAALDRAVRSQRGEARYALERASRIARRALRSRSAIATGSTDERTESIDGALTMALAKAQSPRGSELLSAAREVSSTLGRFAASIAGGQDVSQEDEQVIRRALAIVRGASANVAFKNTLLSLLDASLADLRRGEKNKRRVPVSELVGALRSFVWHRMHSEFPTRLDESCRATFDEVFDCWCGIVGGAHQPEALKEQKHTKHISARLRLVAKLLKEVGAMDEDAKDDSLRGDYHALKRRRAKAAK